MAYLPSEDPLLNLEFYNKFLIVKDPAFQKEVGDLVDPDLMAFYLYADKVYKHEKEWQKLIVRC